MRNSTFKAFTTGCAITASMFAGIIFAGKAHAVPVGDVEMSEQAINYATQYEQAICGAIIANPTNSGVIRVLMMVAADGWTGYESGTIVGYAVQDACPSQWPVLEQFVADVQAAEMATA